MWVFSCPSRFPLVLNIFPQTRQMNFSFGLQTQISSNYAIKALEWITSKSEPCWCDFLSAASSSFCAHRSRIRTNPPLESPNVWSIRASSGMTSRRTTWSIWSRRIFPCWKCEKFRSSNWRTRRTIYGFFVLMLLVVLLLSITRRGFLLDFLLLVSEASGEVIS